MDDDMPKTRSRPAKPEQTQGLSEAELSRMAREAVHQPADSRIDKQLARMGLIDGEATEPQGRQPVGASAVAEPAPELEHLRQELRRAHALLWVLVAVAAVLAAIVVFLLVR
jgi:hypothetical protein